MKNFRGFVQGYNGQAVATEEQIIIASELTNECNDQKQVEPMIEAIAKTPPIYSSSDNVLWSLS